MGPYCSIYGFGALIMLLVLSKYKDDPINLYVMFVVYASILEYFTSYLMEKLFNARWWDYSKVKFNLNGRICLINSLAFGVLGIVLGYLLNPLIVQALSAMPGIALSCISITIMILFFTDLSITFKIISKLRKNIVLLNKDMTEDIRKQVTKFIEKNHIFRAFPLLRQKVNKILGR